MNGPVLLLGKPNSGKSTLFNAMTGLKAKVANYPGITVEAKQGEITRLGGERVKLVDLPGTYSLIPASEEEELSVKAVFGDIAELRHHRLIVVVIDASELRRGLYLYSQLIELGFKTIIALSMVDQQPELANKSALAALQKAVGTYVVPVSANDPASITRLKTTIDSILAGSLRPQIREQPLLCSGLDPYLQEKMTRMGPCMGYLPEQARNSAELIKNHNVFLYRLAKCARLDRNLGQLSYLELSKDDLTALDELIAKLPEQRFKRVDDWIKDLKQKSNHAYQKSELIDRVLLHPLIGSVFLFLLFVSLLQGLFILAQPLGDLLSEALGLAAKSIVQFLPAGSMLYSLLVDGLVEGVGSILSFLPLIALLFLFLAVLEDSGYLSRATYLLDSLLKKVGLCGRSLVPMLSAFACAVPAIMASRTIGNRKERLITILVTPFLTCSARLPVFGLIVGALFSSYPPLFGLINVGALLFLSMYILGLAASLIAASILSRILKIEESTSLTIELPPYRWPQLLSVLKRVSDRIYLFIRDVGGVILATTILVWALFHFEPYQAPESYPSAQIQSPKKKLENSYAGILGQSIEPLVRPLGLDWQVSVGIIASFLAREVFVSTMAVVYGLNDEGENSGLKHAVQKNISPLSGLCLLIFFTLSMQCVSTMAATKRETGSLIWTGLQFMMMTGSAYLLSLTAYFIGTLCGLA